MRIFSIALFVLFLNNLVFSQVSGCFEVEYIPEGLVSIELKENHEFSLVSGHRTRNNICFGQGRYYIEDSLIYLNYKKKKVKRPNKEKQFILSKYRSEGQSIRIKVLYNEEVVPFVLAKLINQKTNIVDSISGNIDGELFIEYDDFEYMHLHLSYVSYEDVVIKLNDEMKGRDLMVYFKDYKVHQFEDKDSFVLCLLDSNRFNEKDIKIKGYYKCKWINKFKHRFRYLVALKRYQNER